MTCNELAETLKKMYEGHTCNKEAVIHLFGIKYADEISKNEVSLLEILESAGVQTSYETEVSKRIKIAQLLR